MQFFSNVLHGPKEPFTKFVANLQEAVRRQVSNIQAVDINSTVGIGERQWRLHMASNPVKSTKDLTHIRACCSIGTESFKTTTMAQITAGFANAKGGNVKLQL